MKPYIAILVDSFWEAISNRVLWALLIGWSLILLALAPFGYVSEVSYKLQNADVSDQKRALERLSDAARGRETEGLKRIVDRTSPKFQALLKTLDDPESPTFQAVKTSSLVKELNRVVESDDLYQEGAFSMPRAESRRKALDELLAIDPAERSDLDREELNRGLLQAALPRSLNRPRGEQLWIGYGSFKLGNSLPISRRQVREYIEPLVLGILIKFGLGILAVMIAIVVTSPIIPDTFRSGSLNLLLSKPISRVLLFLAKFFGSTIFVLVNIAFVLTGLYFIAGMRFGIWNEGLLGCIPLLLFVFVIFYSVSALAGLIWKNAIVCVIATMVFWFFCFAIGLVRGGMLEPFELQTQLVRIQQVGSDLIAVDAKGRMKVWNSDFSVWQQATEGGPGNGAPARTFGPFSDPDRERLLVWQFVRNPFGNLRGRTRNLAIVSLSGEPDVDQQVDSNSDAQEAEEQSAEKLEDAAEDSSVEVGEDSTGTGEETQSEPIDSQPSSKGSSGAELTAKDALAAYLGEGDDDGQIDTPDKARSTGRWPVDSGPEIPRDLFKLLKVDGHLIAICRTKIYKLQLDQIKVEAAKETGLFGMVQMPWLKSTGFRDITPPGLSIDRNTTASASEDGKSFALYSSGTLDLIRLEKGIARIEKTAVLVSEQATSEDDEDIVDPTQSDGTEAAAVIHNDSYCLLARERLPILVLDGDLNEVAQVDLPGDMEVRSMGWRPGSNQASIVTQTGEVLSLDCEQASIEAMAIPVAGKVSCLTWQDASTAWIGVGPGVATLVDLQQNEVIDSRSPSPTVMAMVYRYVVKPVYTINPKPAALDDAMSYLLSGNKTQSMDLITNNLEKSQLELDIWTPIISNLCFVAFVLAISSIYVVRSEF